jgi:hypothetical protein
VGQFHRASLLADHLSYKIVPMGSFSRIEDLPPGKQSYDLCVPLLLATVSTLRTVVAMCAKGGTDTSLQTSHLASCKIAGSQTAWLPCWTVSSS